MGLLTLLSFAAPSTRHSPRARSIVHSILLSCLCIYLHDVSLGQFAQGHLLSVDLELEQSLFHDLQVKDELHQLLQTHIQLARQIRV